MYAACPGGEGDDLKSFELKGFAGSNPVCSAYTYLAQMVRAYVS